MPEPVLALASMKSLEPSLSKVPEIDLEIIQLLNGGVSEELIENSNELSIKPLSSCLTAEFRFQLENKTIHQVSLAAKFET